MALISRITNWTRDESITPYTLNREFDNVANTINNLGSGIISTGAGLLVTTPNGLHTYLIGVDNDGALTSTQVT